MILVPCIQFKIADSFLYVRVTGVIERRRAVRQHTAEFAAENGNVASSAFDKVKMRNGQKPDRRTKIIRGSEGSTPAGEQSQAPQSRAHTPDPEPVGEDINDERKPLLARNQTTR